MGGSANKNKKQRIYERDNGICHYCASDCIPFGNKEHKNKKLSATLDHVQTRASGGNNHDQNLVLACHDCNNMRSCIPYHIFKSHKLWNNPVVCAKFARLFTLGEEMKNSIEGVWVLEMYNEVGIGPVTVQNWGVFASAQAVHVYMASKFPDAVLTEGDEDGYIGYSFPWDHALTEVSFVANIWDLIR